jgi:uncharacterized membrane protein YphA (DoxX/SURF4 family)
MVDTYIAEISRLILFWVMLLGCSGKVRSFSVFNQNISENLNIMLSRAKLITVALIVLEAILCVMLLMGIFTTFAILSTLALLVVFSVWQIYNLIQSNHVNCHCFGESNEPLSYLDLLRNLFLIAAGVLALVLMNDDLTMISVFEYTYATTLSLAAVCVLLHLQELTLLLSNPKTINR